MTRRLRMGVSLMLSCTAALAQPAGSIADLTLEQLSAIQVTSVGKRLQRLDDVAGSVYIITAEDIRRSGATSLPEILRMAPNLQVARVDASQYAISARSGADTLANKMLVLMDGRTIYSPLFSGVFWEMEDYVLDDIERVEVLSGSGGTLYGSNAFHGVVNIITRGAGDTSGTLLKGGAGTLERFVTARHGRAGDAEAFRLYGKTRSTDATRRSDGTAVPDANRRAQAGFRWDAGTAERQWMLQGEVFRHESDDVLGTRDYQGAFLLGRWIADDGAQGRTQVQAYLDRLVRERTRAIRNTVDTFDVEAQQQVRLASGPDLLWGTGWRMYRDAGEPANPAALDLVPRKRNLYLANVFAQGEFGVRDGLKLTAGLKAEHNSYTGLEWLPTLRLAWTPAQDHLVWSAASRVVRTPARVDRDVRSPPLVPSPAFDAERADIYEVGYRGRPAAGVSLSATLFYHRFRMLRSFDLAGAVGSFGNSYRGRLYGSEGWLEWRPAAAWRLKAGYLAQKPDYIAAPGTAPLPPQSTLGNDVRQQFSVGAAWDVRDNLWFDVTARHVGTRPLPRVPSYQAVDLRLGWRPAPGLELSVVVRNATDPAHPEWGAAPARAELPRSALVQVTWRP